MLPDYSKTFESYHSRNDALKNVISDLRWQELLLDTMTKSSWCKLDSGYLRPETGYNFLYACYQVINRLHPQNIIEFNFNEASMLCAQYASFHECKHTILENDKNRVEYLMLPWGALWRNTKVYVSRLLKATWDGEIGVAYKDSGQILNTKDNFIILKCPFGEGTHIHLDVICHLSQIMQGDFAILIDHVEDLLGEKVYGYLIDYLNQLSSF